MNQHLSVNAAAAGTRLDQYLAASLGGSRSSWQASIKQGRVRLQDSTAKPGDIVKSGERIDILPPPLLPRAVTVELTVLYRDQDLVIIDKPAGLLVHSTSPGGAQPTVAAAAAKYTSDQTPGRPGIVHRLDKDTSGLLIIARNIKAKAYLQRLFRLHRVAKTYLALVVGRLEPEAATINLPVGTTPSKPQQRSVHAGGRASLTRYRVERYLPGFSLVRLWPQTGRTHQLRVHLASLGHPIAGDTEYGPSRRPPGLQRQFLHATRLEFSGPHGQAIAAESPLPADLNKFLHQQH